MKKLINDPTTVVSDALAGIAAAHPELRIDHERKVIYRADSPVTGKVGLISGGGSGHEPLHGGFVHLVRSRGREHLTGARGVEHAEADEAAMERLVSGASAGDETHLAGDG